MAKYEDFIPQNIATAEAKRIGVYNSAGRRLGYIPLGNLQKTDKGEKLYSFGALSDVHLGYDTAQADFQKALTYLNEAEDVAFTCVCGDLTSGGHDYQLAEYKTYVDTYSPDTPVYSITGNHDCYVIEDVASVISQYTGKPLYYIVEHGNDVFIMFGESGYTEGNLFTAESLQWLYETLEANRNKRCFVFNHVRPQDGCGNAFGIYANDIWGGTEQVVFESLMRHYKNAHQFHGHSHLKFYLQYGSDVANIDNLFGGWSIHIPSLSVPRDGDVTGANSRQEIYADSEGYVVDVYENGIHLRGRDFVKGEFLPIASYWLDTTLQTIPAGTYTDSIGTITNLVPTSINTDGSIFNGTGYQEGKRLSSSGALKNQTGSVVTGFIPAKRGDVIRMSGATWGTSVADGYCYIQYYDANFKLLYTINKYKNDTVSNGISNIGANVDKSASSILTDSNGITTFNLVTTNNTAYAYIRISATGNGVGMIVTINEEITE